MFLVLELEELEVELDDVLTPFEHSVEPFELEFDAEPTVPLRANGRRAPTAAAIGAAGAGSVE